MQPQVSAVAPAASSPVPPSAARQPVRANLSEQHRHLLQRSTAFYAAARHLSRGAQQQSSQRWADWLFDEAEALSKQQRHSRPAPEGTCSARQGLPPAANDLCARETAALIPFLALHSEAVFAEVGLRCRGRLPLNLALNCDAKEVLSVGPDLQLAVDASTTCAPILQAELLRCPVTFIASELHQYHFRGVTHVLLHNQPSNGVDPATCRAIAARLAASPAFQLLVTTAPLPFQHHLVHIGETSLDHSSDPAGDDSEADQQAGIGNNASNRASSAKRSLPSLGGRTVHLYSTGFTTAPLATISSLYCKTGICCLPTSALHATPRQADDGQGPRRALMELPPLAAHTSVVQDLCSSSGRRT